MDRCTTRSSFEPPPIPGLLFTEHARLRMAQHAIRVSDVEAALAFGHRYYEARAVHYWIGKKEVARWQHRGVDLSALKGLHVVLNHEGAVITVGWRDRHPRKHRSGRPRRSRRW